MHEEKYRLENKILRMRAKIRDALAAIDANAHPSLAQHALRAALGQVERDGEWVQT